MIIVANLGCILLVLLIAYWWANQGLFSALIHLLCVIVAGALALAFWELVTVKLMMKGGTFDDYAWGISLLSLFAVILFVLRVATNKLIPANVDLPRWANLAFGFPVGAASGVLTIGLLVIGLGFIQSQRSIMGFTGHARDSSGRVVQVNHLWLPVHEITDDFYSWASVASFGTRHPLRHYYPSLAAQACSLNRDSFRNGRGQTTMLPADASVKAAYLCPTTCVVEVSFNRGALDYGQQMTIAASQLRLVSAASKKTTPRVAFPLRWRQSTKDDGEQTFQFDDESHYITTIPGRESAQVSIEFPWPDDLTPRFLQIKGTRFEIRADQVTAVTSCDDVLAGGGAVAAPVATNFAVGPKTIRGRDIVVAKDIRPVITSRNVLSGNMHHVDSYLTEGYDEFPPGSASYSRNLQIKGIHEPPGTRIVKLDVSRQRPAALDSARLQAGDSAYPMLVDGQGNTFTAIGYIHETTERVAIKLAPSSGLKVSELPHLPTAGNQKLRLIFRVTEGTNLVAFRLGNVPVATCNLNVPAKN